MPVSIFQYASVWAADHKLLHVAFVCCHSYIIVLFVGHSYIIVLFVFFYLFYQASVSGT